MVSVVAVKSVQGVDVFSVGFWSHESPDSRKGLLNTVGDGRLKAI